MKPLVIVLWLVFTVVILFFFVFFDLGWSTIFVILIGLLIFPFVFLPIITFCSHRLNANPRIEQIHPGKDVVPVEFWDVARDAIDDLAGSGFKLKGHLRMSGWVSSAVTYYAVLENQMHCAIARLAVVFVQTKLVSRVSAMLAFTTEFASGSEVLTANNKELVTQPGSAQATVLWLPEVREADELYHYHQQAVQKCGFNGNAMPTEQEPVEYLRRLAEKEVARSVKYGYYRLDSRSKKYRPTLKGAALLSWKLLPPIKNLRQAWRKYQTNKLLRKLKE